MLVLVSVYDCLCIFILQTLEACIAKSRVIITTQTDFGGTFVILQSACYFLFDFFECFIFVIGLLWLNTCQPLQVRKFPLSAFPKGTTSELAGFSPHYPFRVERQAGKLWIPLFKVFGVTRPRNEPATYRIWDGRSNHYTTERFNSWRFAIEQYNFSLIFV